MSNTMPHSEWSSLVDPIAFQELLISLKEAHLSLVCTIIEVSMEPLCFRAT